MSIPWGKRWVRDRLKQEKLSSEEIETWLGLHERAVFASRRIEDTKGNPWCARDYQVESLESYDSRKVHCDGRDVGKTAEIEIVTVWAAAMCPNSEMLIATQCENHLFPVMHRLLRRFQSMPDFSPSLVEVKRSPSWYLRFSNGFVLWGRIAGPHGMNFQGLHVDWQIIDEAQEMTETAWGELYQALNAGGRRWVYGVPNGLRNTFYRMTEQQGVEQYNWPSSLNPGFTAEKDAELALLYGGRSSPGYIHRVLGKHGTPSHAVFNIDDYLACVNEGIPFSDLSIGEEDTFEAPESVLPMDYYLGCDLGYARDPSEFVVYASCPPDLINVLRVHLHGVNYAKQQDIIVALNAAYNFRIIGIDCGNSGRAVAHYLMNMDDDWCEKIYAIDFGASLSLEPLPDGQPQRRQTKQFMTELLERHMADQTIMFPRLPDRESQYAGHTYTVSANSSIVYDKGDDHIIDADRCAMLAHYRDTHESCPSIPLGMRIESF